MIWEGRWTEEERVICKHLDLAAWTEEKRNDMHGPWAEDEDAICKRTLD